MPSVRAKIVQISDLHMSRRVGDEVTGMLKQIICKLSPDILIVSGDLANQPVPWQMKKAAKFIHEIEQECKKSHPILRTIVIPGNHDFKYWGNFGLGRLSRVPFEIYFRRGGLDHGFLWRCGESFKLLLNAAWWKGRAMREPVVFDPFVERPELGLAVFTINSNSLDEMMAGGKVESADLQRLYAQVDQQAGVSQFPFVYKIAVVHHHPAPIADAPSDAIARVQDTFMIFYNAGLLLRELSRRGFHLVLHGHRHVAGFLRIGCEFPDLGRTELPVAAAGTACHRRPDDSRGHHLHYIEIFDDDTARLTSRFFAADVEQKEATVNYWLDTLTDVRRRRCAIFAASQKYSCQVVTKTVQITADGFTLVQIDQNGCKVVPGQSLDSVPLSLTTQRPSYIRGVDVPQGSSAFAGITPLQGNIYDFKGTLRLGQRHTPEGGLFDYSYCYRLMNGHALNADEFARHYDGANLASEYASVSCEGACNQLVLKVGFPPNYQLGLLEFRASAEYVPAPLQGLNDKRFDRGETKPHDNETDRIGAYLKIESGSVVLTCPEPVPGLIYKICWTFKRLANPPQQDLAAYSAVAAAKNRLLGIAIQAQSDSAASASWNHARSILDELANDINASKPPETLHVSAMVFDDASKRLRFVCANTDPQDLPAGEFISGEGCAGFVFEKARTLLYHPARDALGYFIHSNEWPTPRQDQEPVVLISFPWIHNIEENQKPIVIGVVNVSSFVSTSKLLPLFGPPGPQRDAELDRLQRLVAMAADQLYTI
jgi:hypothetical protein